MDDDIPFEVKAGIGAGVFAVLNLFVFYALLDGYGFSGWQIFGFWALSILMALLAVPLLLLRNEDTEEIDDEAGEGNAP